jgi:ubiquinone biosynthesis protein
LQPYRPTQIVAEFQRLLRRELDFTCERRHLDYFVRAFKESESVKIPYSHPDLSTERVLVMEWLDGVPLSDHERVRAMGIDLAQIARAGAEVYLEMIFRHGVYHADPHPGNLLLMPDGKIGLLDFGMVVRMDDKTRDDIEELLLAIVEQDAGRLCSVVMRVGDVPPGLDETNLGLDLADFVAHYSQQSIDKLELGAALSEMIDIMLQYKIVLPSAMTLLLKVLIMLEGTAKKLEPNFCLMEVLETYQSKIMARRLSPARQWRKARKFVYELQQLAEVLPRRVRDILQQVQSGRFDVHLDHRGLEPSVNRLVLGMLTSALFLGSTMMVTYNVWPIWNVSVPGAMGFVLSGLLGLRLLWAINKSGKLDRRK